MELFVAVEIECRNLLKNKRYECDVTVSGYTGGDGL